MLEVERERFCKNEILINILLQLVCDQSEHVLCLLFKVHKVQLVRILYAGSRVSPSLCEQLESVLDLCKVEVAVGVEHLTIDFDEVFVTLVFPGPCYLIV